MFDPFKRVRSKAARKLRRATFATISDAWGAMLAPAKPARRKTTKAAKKSKTPTSTARNAKENSPPIKQAAKRKATTTALAKTTFSSSGVFKKGTHETEFGTRSYRLYVPTVAKTTPDPLPLLVMMHGCGQSPEDFARGIGMNALAEEFGFLVLYPAQARKVQLHRCWNWFKLGDQARDAGEPAVIADMTRHIIAEQNADPARIYVAGLSAGAAAALIVATEYPDIFAAVGVHSGLAVGAAHDGASATVAMQAGDPGRRHNSPMPAIIFHSDKDKVVNPRNGRYVALRALEPYGNLDRTEKTGRVPGGRDYTRTVHRVGKGRSYLEHWVVHGAGHAWSGGKAAGTYTDPTGPNASREMVRFFLRHRTTKKRRSTPVS